MEDNYEEFALLNEEMDDPFSNKIPLWPMNQKKTVAAMEKVLSEANSKNINNFKQIPVSLGRGIEKNYGIVDRRMQQNATQNANITKTQ